MAARPEQPKGLAGLVASVRLAFAFAPRTMRLVYAADPVAAVAIFLLSTVASLFPVAIAYVGKLVVDAVVRAVSSRSAADRDQALLAVGLELGLMLGTGVFAFLATLLRGNLGTRLAYYLHARILEKALALDLVHFEQPELYDKLQNARREAGSRPMNVFNGLIQVVGNAVAIASFGAALLAFSGWALAVMVAAMLPGLLIEAKYSGEAFRVFTWQAPDQRKMRYVETLLTTDTTVKEVKLYELGAVMLARYRALYQALFEEERALNVRRSVWSWALGTLSTAALYGCYGWIVLRTIEGALTLGGMTLYISVFRSAQGSARVLLRSIGSMYEDNLFMSNLFGFLDVPTSTPAPRLAPPPPTSAQPPPRTGFVLEHVSFRYAGAPRFVLEDVSLTIGPEEKLAIVGENGAGKTTLVKLLTGLYPPTSGRITLDGVPLDAYEPSALRARLAVVLQDFARYQLTARDNVGLGKVEHLDDAARLQSAAEKGGASEVVAGLPSGWDTQLGRWFEGGVELSLGSWQKLAVSRAFMRDADVLILDEPTAALDAEAEHALFERFKALTAGKLAILVSHRFSTVRMADRILVLHGGHIEELGGHDELLAKGGRYARLFRLQAAGYRGS